MSSKLAIDCIVMFSVSIFFVIPFFFNEWYNGVKWQWIKLSLNGVYPDEVEEVFANRPVIRRLEKGDVSGENLYRALGQTSSGRYLAVFFVYKPATQSVLIISSRDMTYKEQRSYHE